jgi:hypothetical protein
MSQAENGFVMPKRIVGIEANGCDGHLRRLAPENNIGFPLSDAAHLSIKHRIDGQMELIVGAAIRCEGVIITVERPGRHGNRINFMHALGIDHVDQGFIANRGRFVDRQQGATHETHPGHQPGDRRAMRPRV